MIHWWRSETTAREMLTKLFAVFYWQLPESPYGLDRAEEFNENRPLFELKAKYFTKKYANLMKQLKYEDKDWDFDCDENDLKSFKLKVKEEGKEKEKEKEKEKNNNANINLVFSDRGRRATTIQCGIDELMRDVIQRCLNKFGISEKIEEILFISNCRRLNMNSSVEDNKLQDNCKIDIIYDVLFA